METKFEILFDTFLNYNNILAQKLDSQIELLTLNYFNKGQNHIKIINGGYEESISSFIYHELFRFDNLAYLEQKIYLASKVTPKPDMFFTSCGLNNNNDTYNFCNENITCFIEFGHHFSFAKKEHINKTLEDFVKWRKLFNQYNFEGEIVTIQYITHLTKIDKPYSTFYFHNMAERSLNLNQINHRKENIDYVRTIYQSMGTLKKHSSIEYNSDLLSFNVHIFINTFPISLSKIDLLEKLPADIKHIKAIEANNHFWKVK